MAQKTGDKQPAGQNTKGGDVGNPDDGGGDNGGIESGDLDKTQREAQALMDKSFGFQTAMQAMMLSNQARLQASNMISEVAQGALASVAKLVSTAVQTAKDGIGNAAKAAEKIQ